MAFKDHFSEHAESYAAHRPDYPDQLFQYLAALAPGRHIAWDCGTGNGQAARALIRQFDRVIATDASAEQLGKATKSEGVTFLVEEAEHPSIASGTIDLVTVAVAMHWFEFDKFYAAVKRVLKPGGILAVWGYHLPVVNPDIDRIIEQIYDKLIGYWPAGFEYLDNQYRSLPFPFEEVEPPQFFLKKEWALHQLAGFIESWSGSQRYNKFNDVDLLEEFWDDLTLSWRDPQKKKLMRWPLFMRVGKYT